MKLFHVHDLASTTFLSISCGLLTALSISNPAIAQEFTRSTIPLKLGGSMTSIQSQGQRIAYLSGEDRARDAAAGNPDRRETGFVPSPNAPSDSFYRQNQRSDSQIYPYPASANGRNSSINPGFNSPFNTASAPVDNGRADLRFERSGIGERPSGSLGDNRGTNRNANNRTAQLPQPPTRPPQSQFPAPQAPEGLPNPTAALPSAAQPFARPPFAGQQFSPAANCNCGPNYANPAANYPAGFQGYQPFPQAANSVPALNIQLPPRGGPNPAAPNGFAQQPPGSFGRFNGYQFQPGIGAPQFNTANTPWWSSFLTGSGQYTPLVQFRNMPPGTYLGQGLIGQPTAYVDGQPIRNLLRYVAP